jgi:hypothetical protein
MTGSPEFEPPQKKSENPQRLSAQIPSDNLLSGQEISQVPLSMEYLLAADLDRLSDTIERALGDIELLNEFIDKLSPLCADSTQEMEAFHDRLCQAVAVSLKKHEKNRFEDQYNSLLNLSHIVEFFFDALQDNSVKRMPTSIHGLLHASVEVVQKLASDRHIVSSSETLKASTPEEFLWRSVAWGRSYAQVLDHIGRGLTMSEAPQSSDLIEKVKQLVEGHFDWKREGLGPLQCNHAGVIRIWDSVFLLADTLADSRFSDAILGFAEEFLKRRLSEEPDVVVSESDSDEDIDIKNTIADALDMCECSTLYALASCQYDLRPVPLWQEILDKGSFMSEPWCLALVALAKLDPSETEPHLVQLLNRLGKKPGSQSEEKALRKNMRDELMRYLDMPLTELALVRVFDRDAEAFVEPTRHERLMRLFNKMLEQPDERWNEQALKRLRWAYERL